jgi:valyl-tRNA synthetase
MKLSKHYQPSEVEKRVYQFWDKASFFRADITKPSKGPFSIVIPPPNVTGRLHMGHALNNTLQDVLIRYKRMDGYNACWFPGTDHAGIATQNVVEKVLAEEGTSRHEIGRQAFVSRVWQWKEKYGSEIIGQLKTLGCSCDWSRQRFTLDEGLSEAVRQAFVKLYEEDLIYRGSYMINWCPRCETALSDIEVEHKEIEGNLYYVKYPLKDGGYITIATTRPETMLGDSGVAVNPNDKRHNHLIGKIAILPLLNRELPIVSAEEVDPEFGTGVLKITPAHDPIDLAIGKRNKLAAINIFTNQGKINENGQRFAGLTREQAQEAVVAELRKQGLLEKIVPYTHAVGHCQRCQTAVEPLVSTQWFVRMKPLAKEAIAAVRDGRVRFIPQRWEKLYFDWMENIQDWCISRQLWWGHRIPVWYGPDDKPFAAHNEREAQDKAREYYAHPVKLRQEEDVLDTWFSSSLWPFSVMGWPEKTADFDYFYPSSVLVTGFDILFFWVSRMLIMGLHFTGQVPFPEVYITPLIVDAKGQKMSKSKGNSIDPMEVKETYGMDALRFSLAQSTSKGRSMRLPQSLLDEARNFLNKVWNMSRFVLLNLEEDRPKLPTKLTALEDRFILSRLSAAISSIRDNIEDYSFNLAVEALYSFVWHDFCDWYLEMAKERLSTTDQQVRGVLYYTLKEILKLLHPFVPFISEELWQTLEEEPCSISLAKFPEPFDRDYEAEDQMGIFQQAVRAVRSIRAELSVPQSAKPRVIVRTSNQKLKNLIEKLQGPLCTLCQADSWQLLSDTFSPPKGSARQVITEADLFIPLSDFIDIDAEKVRIEKELAQVEADLQRVESNLANSSFLTRAPKEVVDKEKEKQKEFLTKADRLKANLKSLEG